MKRRSLMLAGAATLAPAAAVPQIPAAPHPDGELIAACTAMIAAQRAYNAIYDGPDAIADSTEADAAAAPHVARWTSLLDEMQRLRASTTAGITARAQALAFHTKADAFSFDYPGTMTARMLDYLLRDAAALPAEVRA